MSYAGLRSRYTLKGTLCLEAEDSLYTETLPTYLCARHAIPKKVYLEVVDYPGTPPPRFMW